MATEEEGYQGNPLLKKVGVNHDYTPDEIKEYVKCAKDPIYFIRNYVKIVSLDEGLVPFEMYDFQEKIIRTVHENRFTIGKLPRQTGKALSLDTPIPTPYGWTIMGDIEIGDEILGADGTPTRVTFATEVMHDHKIYELEFDTGVSIKADAEHLWNVSCSDWRNVTKTITTKELVKQHQTKRDGGRPIYIETTEPIQYSNKDVDISPWVLGFWLGDGNARDGRYTSAHDDNTFITEEIKRHGYIVSEPIRDKRQPNTERTTIYNLYPMLRRMNLLGNKHIPSQYIYGSIDQRLALVQGLMDSDGSVGKNGACEFYQKSRNIIDSFRQILFSLGIKNRIREKQINGEIYYTVSFATTRFDLFRLPRKLERQQKCMNHPKLNRHYINRISEIDSVPVRCIQVDNDDHLFLCSEAMIPTHNTTTICAYFLHYTLFNDNVNCAILANKGSLARDILARYQLAYENLPFFLQQGVLAWNKGSIELENGSKIIAASTSSSAIRGGSFNMLLLDEFAFVPRHIAEEFFASTYPTISSGKTTKMVIISTPCGMNHYYRMWMDANEGKSEYVPIDVHWSEVPGRDEEWKESTIRNTSKEQFAQEFESLEHCVILNIDRGNGPEQAKIGDLYEEIKAYQTDEK